MVTTSLAHSLTRRDLFRAAGLLTGGALLTRIAPAALFAQAAQTPTAADGIAALNARRNAIGAAPIKQTPLADRVVLLSGPGGNVIVFAGPDGKLLVDGFVQNAWSGLKTALNTIDPGPLKLMIDTHWHFDHADNNENAHNAGAAILAHENTKKRLSEAHDLLGMHIDPTPAAALPTQTFATTHKLHINGDDLALQHVAPAHTDTDIFIHFAKANVLHMGDVFFNGTYPFIDASTAGTVNGMIAATARALKLVDAQTKIVPGHGPLGDKAALTSYHTMMVTCRDAVQKLKRAGKSLADVQAAKPNAAFDEAWGKGSVNADTWIAQIYSAV